MHKGECGFTDRAPEQQLFKEGPGGDENQILMICFKNSIDLMICMSFYLLRDILKGEGEASDGIC